METLAQLEKNCLHYSGEVLRRKEELGYVLGSITPDHILQDAKFQYYNALYNIAFRKFQKASKEQALKRPKNLSFEERQKLFKIHRDNVNACSVSDTQ
jgi:hypothetical protein